MPKGSFLDSCGGFKRILEMGYEGIAQDAQKRIDEMKASGCVDNDKIDFYLIYPDGLDFDKMIEFAGAGATVPICGFGYSLAKGTINVILESGIQQVILS